MLKTPNSTYSSWHLLSTPHCSSPTTSWPKFKSILWLPTPLPCPWSSLILDSHFLPSSPMPLQIQLSNSVPSPKIFNCPTCWKCFLIFWILYACWSHQRHLSFVYTELIHKSASPFSTLKSSTKSCWFCLLFTSSEYFFLSIPTASVQLKPTSPLPWTMQQPPAQTSASHPLQTASRLNLQKINSDHVIPWFSALQCLPMAFRAV